MGVLGYPKDLYINNIVIPMNMAKKRGRLPGSQIRDNMIEILAIVNPIHGYDIYKHYKKKYGAASLRSIYYHLKKGTELGVFESKGIQKIEGDFSWGSGVERKVFALGPNAKPRGTYTVKDAGDLRA